MKTRVAELTNSEYVPQVWVPHFLWGGHWEGIHRTEDGGLWRYEDESSQLDKCAVATEEEAEEILQAYIERVQKKELLR